MPKTNLPVLRHLVAALLFCLLSLSAATAGNAPVLATYLDKVDPSNIVPGADAFGDIRPDVPVAPVLKGGETLGYAFVTSDFVGTTGYSGKPIHIVVGISPDAVITGAVLVKHSEPIVLVGIPEAKIRKMITGYVGTDLKQEVAESGSAHELDIISGATVTVMVIEDSVIRASVRVARALGLGRWRTLQKVTFPQLVRHALPGLANISLILQKETALVSVLALDELLRNTQIAVGATKEPLFFYGIACAIYVAIAFVSSLAIGRVERWSNRGLEEA